MNDDDLMTAVREPFAGVHMSTPLDAVVTRGRSLRRRRLPGLTAASVSAAAAVAVGVSAIAGGTGGSGPATASLAAWTVVKQPGGMVAVTVRELSDPAGLQRTLNAVHVPAVVVFAQPVTPQLCIYPGITPALLGRILRDRPPARGAAFYIDSSAIPHGARLWLDVGRTSARTTTGAPATRSKPRGSSASGAAAWPVTASLISSHDCAPG